VGRLPLVALAILLAVSCQNQTHPIFSPVPSPSPHTAATDAILQSADVPAGLNPCLGSGPIDVYVTALANSDATLAGRESDQWLQLRNQGAQEGAISIFAANSPACSTELGATTSVKAMTSLVARFGDPGEADRAWSAGFFGFAPPPVGELAPGIVRGTSTGLGISSFTYDRPSVRLASWHRSVFVALVVVSNMDQATFTAATAAIDPRLN
jgi:hypothetical protein